MDQMATRKKQFQAVAIGLLVGGFLFYQFGFDKDGRLFAWHWYQGAVLFAAIGLAGVFRVASNGYWSKRRPNAGLLL